MSHRKPAPCPVCKQKRWEDCGRVDCGKRKEITATCPGRASTFPAAGQRTPPRRSGGGE